MNNSQIHLHSENFDLCRICLLEPESNRNVKFVHIFSLNNEGVKINQLMLDLLGINVNANDIKPKIVCENCYKSLLSWIEMKKKGSESQVVIDYIAKKKFAANIPELNQSSSNNFASSLNLNNKRQLTNASHSSTRSQKNLIISNKSISKSTLQINYYGSANGNQGNSSQSLDTNPSITSDEYVNIEDYKNDDDDDDDDFKEVPINEIIYVSDSEVSANPDESELLNDESYYCSICKQRKNYNHNCYKFNKNFCTCLVPNCNIICRSLKDFIPHFRQHIGLSAGALLCYFCFQECTVNNSDNFGNHVCRTHTFKCYACNAIFNSMPKFATHKLKAHNGRLINCKGNFLCLYCEKSTSELTDITEHIKHCRENRTFRKVQYSIKHRKSNINQKNVKEELIVSETKKSPKLRTSQHKLFTCLRQSCNLIFQSFPVFKFHHREHFGIGNRLLMCWQCCSPFNNVNSLRIHQVQGNCRKPGMFKCYECNKNYDDIQNLSIHKYTEHDGDLICKNKKTMNCIYCSFVTDINNFKSHLVQCQFENQINNISNSRPIQNSKYRFKCTVCTKICLTQAALSSHKKIHDPTNKRNLMKTKQYELINSHKETNAQMDLTLPSTSQCNKTINTGDLGETSSSNNKEICDEINKTLYIDEKEKPINYDKVPYIDGSYFCLECPKKFISKQGLSRHMAFCSNVRLNTKAALPCNYYCTKCKESYTRSGFNDHWKKNHGKRLPYIKNKRYPCDKCKHKFVYKIALIMHREHKHGEVNNPVIKEKTPVNCFPMIPNEANSLAEESTENIESEQIIKQEFINTILDNPMIKCDEPVISEFEYISECDDNEPNVSRKIGECNTSNHNEDNNENDVDVHNVHHENETNNESNNVENIPTIQFHEDTIVNNVNEIEKNIEDDGFINNVTSIKKECTVEITSTSNIKEVINNIN